MFAFEKDSEAEAKTAISFAPAATAASKPCPNPTINIINSQQEIIFNLFYYQRTLHTFKFGVNTGNLAPSKFLTASTTSLASASFIIPGL